MQRTKRLPATIVAAALAAAPSTAMATPQHLDCVLTDTESKPGSESRPVAVVFDEDAKTLSAEASGHSYSFGKVTITYIAISGQIEDVSIGIDRSSFGIVWQQYRAGNATIEYGRCWPAPAAQ